MEGLIPYVIHAIKKRRERSKYRCLSLAEGSSRGGGSRRPLVAAAAAAEAAEEEWPPRGGGGGHRRARSEFPAGAAAGVGSEWFPNSDLRGAASRSVREGRR